MWFESPMCFSTPHCLINALHRLWESKIWFKCLWLMFSLYEHLFFSEIKTDKIMELFSNNEPVHLMKQSISTGYRGVDSFIGLKWSEALCFVACILVHHLSGPWQSLPPFHSNVVLSGHISSALLAEWIEMAANASDEWIEIGMTPFYNRPEISIGDTLEWQ